MVVPHLVLPFPNDAKRILHIRQSVKWIFEIFSSFFRLTPPQLRILILRKTR